MYPPSNIRVNDSDITKIYTKEFLNINICGKFNGATGNYSAHSVTFPNIDWPKANKKFIESFGVKINNYTTQIEPHDYICELSNKLSL